MPRPNVIPNHHADFARDCPIAREERSSFVGVASRPDALTCPACRAFAARRRRYAPLIVVAAAIVAAAPVVFLFRSCT
jgi:hypothetical protein